MRTARPHSGELFESDRPQPEDEVGSALADAQVREAVRDLPEAERNVVALRFGLTGDEPRSLRQAGAQLGISAERARRLEQQALSRLAQTAELEELRAAA